MAVTIAAYAGIGSRSTPTEIEPSIEHVASVLAARGFTLRSGAAPGADAAFEKHAHAHGGACEIWLPWRGFNGHSSPLTPSPRAFEIAESVHPAWARCSEAARKLHARNVHQILGADLVSPVSVVVCWTPNGKTVGGTATAIRLAQREGIVVQNLWVESVRAYWQSQIAERP